jgi:hypothetical protein
MSKTTRRLAVATAALVILSASAADAGELVSAYSATIGQAATGVRFLNPDLSTGSNAFLTQSQANGLAVGANGIYAGFSADHTTRRYSPAGTPQLTLTGNSDYMPGALAFGDDRLFQAYSSGNTSAIAAYTPTFGVSNPFMTFSSPVTGLAFGDDSLFISFGSTLQRRDLAGNILQSNTFAGIFDSYALGSLAYGDGVLFMGYDRTIAMSETHHRIGYLDPNALTFNSSFEVGDQVRGLAYGEGQLFASYDFKLASYNATGDQTNSLVTATFGVGSQNGALAYLPTGSTCRTRVCEPPVRDGPVPEPETWSLLILGFGAAGAALRASRRRQAALNAT